MWVNAQWFNSEEPGTIAVNVPAGTSIDILAPASPAPVPALSPLALLATALLLVAGALGVSRLGASTPQA